MSQACPGSAVAQWLNVWLRIERPRVGASLASLRCGPWARHIYPSLVLVQPRKTRPCLTERLLMGHKESNQTKNNPNVTHSVPTAFVMNAVGTEWVTPGLPRMTLCMRIIKKHSEMEYNFLAHLLLKTSCSIGKTPCGISLSHSRDLLIPSTWPAYPIHVTSNYNNLGCFQSNLRLNIM